MIRRNEEKNSLCNRDDLLRRLSNGYGETDSKHTDPPLMLDSISTKTQTTAPSNVSTISPRSIHGSSNDGHILRPKKFSFDAVTSSPSKTVPDSPFVLDSGPADKTVSPVRTSLVITATPTPIYRGRQDGSSPEIARRVLLKASLLVRPMEQRSASHQRTRISAG
jgi:hypothetical protein